MVNRKSALAISCCPSCESKGLMEFEGDYFCLECSWDSLALSVARGDLDDALYAFEEAQVKQFNHDKSNPANSVDASMSENLDRSAA